MRYYAVKYGHVWRLSRSYSPEEAAQYLFGVPLSSCSEWKDLGTRKDAAVKALRELC